MPRIRNQRPTNVDYYRRNREQELFRVKARQAGTREMLRELRDVPCTDCGQRFEPHQMDFDHRDPETKQFNLMASHAAVKSTAALRAEAAKCDIVCANCHSIRTQRMRPLFRRRAPGKSTRLQQKRRIWREHIRLLNELRSVPCADCGETFPPFVLEFDHRDAVTKLQCVTQMVGRAGFDRIAAEAAKCDIVCANCHRMRTYLRREAASGRSSVG